MTRGGVRNCWVKKQKSVALSSWESELFAAITSGTRSLGIQGELMDLGYSCSVTVATDSQSVIDHLKRRGHSVASKHVGLRGLWLQEALVDGKLELEKVDTAMNPADVCTKATESASCVGLLAYTASLIQLMVCMMWECFRDLACCCRNTASPGRWT